MTYPLDDPQDLSTPGWDWLRRHSPIPCVDLLPVVRDRAGGTVRIGLIRRQLDNRQVWCHLGGRIRLGEQLQEAAQRHFTATLLLPVGTDSSTISLEPVPFTVTQYFPTEIAGHGVDTTKHAVAQCFRIVFDREVEATPSGEATEFRWFTRDSLPQPEDFWPGSRSMIATALDQEWSHDELTYQAVQSRFVTHNQLMWQTPVLAMTAMAFLLTIALGSGTPWTRALAGLLSMLVAAVSVQLMVKHSRSQIDDAEVLYAIERHRLMRPVHAPPADAGLRPPYDWVLRTERWLARHRSRRWWTTAMATFGLVSFAVAVLAVLGF